MATTYTPGYTTPTTYDTGYTTPTYGTTGTGIGTGTGTGTGLTDRLAGLLPNIDYNNLCTPVYLSLATTALEIILILAVKGWKGTWQSLFSLLFGIITAYTINCLCIGQCDVLAWIWALLPLIMVVMSLLSDYVEKRKEGFNSYPSALYHSASGGANEHYCSKICKCNKDGGECKCSDKCDCGCKMQSQPPTMCPGIRNLNPLGSSLERQFYRPRFNINSPVNPCSQMQ